MQNYVNILSNFLLPAILFLSCTAKNETTVASGRVNAGPTLVDTPFTLPQTDPSNYWFQGKAELAAYHVEQERYGEMRQAEEVIVFVTEDFSKSKLVKLDDPQAAGNDRAPVLKTNVIRKFITGIYDYSLMESVFVPLDGSPALKATCTVQDWCGHVFGQFNYTSGNTWKAKHFSYFESEGDSETTVKADYLEDELINRIRLDPSKIKTGKASVIPSDFYLRMRHQPLVAAEANLSISNTADRSVLELQYTSIDRTLQVTFENKAPWRITGWEETAGGKLMSKGTLKALRMEPYWSQHSNADLGMRDSLRIGF